MRWANGWKIQYIFVRFMIPYFLFMLFTLLAGALFYRQTYDVVKKEVTHSNLQMLDQVKETVDSRFNEINRISLQLQSDPAVQSFQQVKEPFRDTTAYKVYRTQKSLYSYNAANGFILNYYLIFKNSDLALSPDSTYELPSFYRYMFSEPSKDYTTWRNDLLGHFRNREIMSSGSTVYQGKTKDLLTYVQSLGYPGHIQGALMILVDNQRLQSLLRGIDISDGGWVSIVDEKGRLVTSLSSGDMVTRQSLPPGAKSGVIEASAATGGMMMTYTTSSYNGWSYVVAQPPHVVLSKVLAIKHTTVTILLAFLIFGLILAYLFATRSGRPIVNITTALTSRLNGGELKRPKDMYGYIQHSLARLIDNNDELQQEIERQAPLLRESFFGRLLQGEYLMAEHVESLLKHQNADIQGRGCAVGIVQFHRGGHRFQEEELRELDIERVIIQDMLGRTLKGCPFTYPVAEDKIAVLFVNGQGDPGAFRKTVERELQQLTLEISRHGLQAGFAVGGYRPSLLEVPESFEEARQALSRLYEAGTGQSVWFEDLAHDHRGFYFPAESENRLMNYIKAGETDEVRKLLASLYRENFEERHLSLAMQQLFVLDLVGCLVKVQDQLMVKEQADMRHLLQQLGTANHPKQAFDNATERFAEISDDIDRRKKSRNVQLIRDTVDYIHHQYGQADLSLDAAADHLNISKGYLSQFFKEQTGVNFSEYVENLRMDKAKQLLSETRLPIRDIAQQVGYHASSTFCRAFKRGSGISATAYRDIAHKKPASPLHRQDA